MAAKEIIASVAISILVLAPTAFFVLPLVYPDMKDGGTVQYVYEEFDDRAFIVDSDDTFELINQTTLSVTTKGKSLLSILLVMPAVLTLSDLLVGGLQFEIALTVSGVGNRTSKVAYYAAAPSGIYQEIPASISLTYVTEELTAGTYIISVYGKSLYDLPGSSALIFNNPPNFDYIRSISVEEIRV